MASKARVLYDFEGDVENGELVVSEGTVITILNQDVGEGWWEGQLANGDVGLFPEQYVEMVSGNGSAPSPAANMDGFQSPTADPNPGYDQPWEEDDEWDTRQDGGEAEGGGAGAFTDHQYGAQAGDEGRGASPGERSASMSFGRAGTVRKNINRFSPFVKTGSEAFVLGRVVATKSQPSPSDTLRIILSPENSPMWEPHSDPYSVQVRDPEKKSKFKGIKNFTAYSIIPSSTGRAVSRRYKHYDWMHERLVEKFTVNCVPPLPDKQYYGRYGEEFVEKRREKLQAWSNRVARHPVLSRSEVFSHFILCDDEGSKWKAGKRRAEKDDVVGAALFQTFTHDVTVDLGAAESQVEHFGVFLRTMRQSVAKMRLKFIDHCNQMSGPFMAEYQKMGGAINGVAQCFAMESKEYNKTLTDAMSYTAETFRDIGALHHEQPRHDMLPALDVLKEYLGLMFSFPEIVQVHHGAVGKVRDCEKMKEEGRIDYTDATDITTRSETVSAAVLAEIYHFQHERVVDFKEMMKALLREQIRFNKEITSKLEEAMARYDEATDL